jgi:hydrogenase nickel incorporation protein HypA/HybF
LHELAISEAIVSEICAAVSEPVIRVVVEIGALSAVVPDAVRFAWELATEGTVVAGAALEIIEIPGMGECRQCRARTELRDITGMICRECGTMDLDIKSGNELRIRSVEVA